MSPTFCHLVQQHMSWIPVGGIRVTLSHVGQVVFFAETLWTRTGKFTVWQGGFDQFEPAVVELPKDDDRRSQHLRDMIANPDQYPVLVIQTPPVRNIHDINDLVRAGWRVQRTHANAENHLVFVLIHQRYR